MIRNEMSSFNLLVSASARAPKRSRREAIERLRQAGDEAPLVIDTDRGGMLAVHTRLDARAVIRALRAQHEASPTAFRYTSKWVPVDLWTSPDLSSMRAAVARLRDRIAPGERWRLSVERRSAGGPRLDAIIDALAALVDAPVDLRHPDKIVRVEVFTDRAALAVVTPEDTFSVVAATALAAR